MTSTSSHACCTFAPVGVAPMLSIVVTARVPIALTGRRQERTGLPSMCTVQAPHCAMPQPNFVPVIPSTSRRTQSSGVSSGASKVLSSPLIFSVAMASLLPALPRQHILSFLLACTRKPRRHCARPGLVWTLLAGNNFVDDFGERTRRGLPSAFDHQYIEFSVRHSSATSRSRPVFERLRPDCAVAREQID